MSGPTREQREAIMARASERRRGVFVLDVIDATWPVAYAQGREDALREVEALPFVYSGLGHIIEGGEMVERDRVREILGEEN